MRVLLPLLVALAVAVPALADDPEPYVRGCDTSAFGDLGRGWQKRAVSAGPVAFVGLRNGYGRDSVLPGLAGRGRPLKVLVVVAPNARPTVRIAARSRRFAALGYNGVRNEAGGNVSLSSGTHAIRFEACRAEPSRAVWNRGTQFPGYFLVSGRRCVHVEIAARGEVLRRTLRFGVSRCA